MGWLKGHLLWVKHGREASGVVFVIRKALGTSVLRNRLKRRLRHICFELGSRQSSLVIFPQPAAGCASFSVLKKELYELVKRLEESQP